ncbi:MAG: hypothetical protein JSR17_10275 [Proteobacteria bacterium]|nr:hypothetical protein [Pseudomonadota bacterium]
MKTLTMNEIEFVSGGYGKIRPSDWLFPATGGIFTGALVFTVTAFSANPVGLALSLGTGFSVGAGIGALYNTLVYFDL